MKLSPINTEKTDKLIELLREAMEKESNFYEKLVSYTDIGMVILDRQTSQFLFANSAAQRIYNRNLDELRILTLNCVTVLDYIEEENKGFALLNSGDFKSYKMAKAYVIPPDNIQKIAFIELVEIATELQFPYILGLIIEQSQLKSWYDMTKKISNILNIQTNSNEIQTNQIISTS